MSEVAGAGGAPGRTPVHTTLGTLPHIDDDRYSTHRYALLVTDPDDWVLLAQWVGFPMSILYWTITRQDLAARRFDRAAVQMHANP
ncbi:hypothetical protein ACFW34_26870 [Streptomyces sp. NPDC058848]|uniref:hypothetical protein n=1 Tax=unclassified Streptomyces TaxID=2593676 RepID=UPI0036820959